jgi:hypothetical protein
MRLLLPLAAIFVCLLTACSMFSAWRSIPPPGGCEECHKVPISANWQLTYRPATLYDERGGQPFQTPESMQPTNTSKPNSPLDKRKVEQASCFECHKSPDAAHKSMKGNFHH